MLIAVLAIPIFGGCGNPMGAGPTATPAPVATCADRGLANTWYNSDNTFYKTVGTGTVGYNGVNGPISFSTAPSGTNTTYINARWTGYVLADNSGTYTFFAASDDGSRVWIDGTLVVDNWFDQSMTERSGTIALTGGAWHTIRVDYYQGGGPYGITVSWTPPSGSKALVPLDHTSQCL